jgi:SSS family solute:Na+ symporter/sodium/pantothenate symporter
MRYLELIAERPLIWGLFLVYMIVTAVLAWIGHRRTGDLESFAVGRGDMGPAVVGITLAASIASTATFVINPGFIYAHGVSALLHLGVASSLGIAVGLVAMSAGFQRIGKARGAVTLPGWIGARYGSRRLATAFAAINLLSLCFVVLILGGLSIVMQQTLGLTNAESLILMIAFVFGYVFVGGAYAHAYTNTLQGIVMTVVAVVIVGSGLHLLAGGLGAAADRLAAVDPSLVRGVNPASPLFGSFFSVYVSGFVIGFALVCQPHIMTKALYVKDRRAIRRTLGIAIVIGAIFSALLLVGLYTHLAGVPAAAMIDPATGAFRQDAVMTAYLTHTFSPAALAVITVALMAAGMSTLDGILVALSSIAASDLFLPVAERRWLAGATAAEKSRAAHRASQLVLVAIGVAAFAIALDPPRLLGIFGQLGVYGIVAASAVPILFGVAAPRFGASGATMAAAFGLVTHFGLYAWGQLDASAPASLANPGVTATVAILASFVAGAAALAAPAFRGAPVLAGARAEVRR